MITTKHIEQHGKCLAILGMIQKTNDKIMDAKLKIQTYDNGDPFNMLRMFVDRDELVEDVARYNRIKTRLINYYADIMVQIIQPVIIKTINNEPNNSGATGTQTPGEGFFRTPGGTDEIQGIAGKTRQFIHDQRSANCGVKQFTGKS